MFYNIYFEREWKDYSQLKDFDKLNITDSIKIAKKILEIIVFGFCVMFLITLGSKKYGELGSELCHLIYESTHEVELG